MKVKHWVKIGIFTILSALILSFLINLMCVANERDAVGIYGFFLEPEDSIDVVLIGSSEIYTHFYSPLAYEEQGFTSYSISTSTMTAPLYKYAAQLAIEYQHPQLLVFDVWSFRYDNQLDETSLRKFIDSLPECEIKKAVINELVDEELKSSFFFPFEKYHASYDRFGSCLKVLGDKIRMKQKGYSVTKNFATYAGRIDPVSKKGQFTVSDEGLKYLEELLKYLKEADIENVLFIRTPEMYSYESTDSYKQMIEMIRGAGFDFLNLNAAVKDIGLDHKSDFYDTSHFNIYGTEKYTKFLSDYFMHVYQLDTEHSEEVTAEWDECAGWNEEILSKLKSMTDENTGDFLYTQKDFLD